MNFKCCMDVDRILKKDIMYLCVLFLIYVF